MCIYITPEPTNMLDLKAVMWLESYLQVLCSHYTSIYLFFCYSSVHMVCVGVVGNAIIHCTANDFPY